MYTSRRAQATVCLSLSRIMYSCECERTLSR